MSELTEKVIAFMDRFEEWVMHQPEKIKLGTAMMFGREYEQMKEAVTKNIPSADGGGAYCECPTGFVANPDDDDEPCNDCGLPRPPLPKE